MIQRIQSVYLLLTIILAGLFLTGNFFQINTGDSSCLVMNINGVYEATSGDDFLLTQTVMPVLVISLIIPVLSLISIFLYRNRKLQMKAILLLLILDILLIGICGYYIHAFIIPENGNMIPVLRMFIPAINMVLAILAYFAVRKDEKMVRSYDRLR